MRVCFASDFHGSRTLYGQLEDLLRAETPDLVILGGDMLPDGDEPDPDGTQAAFVTAELGPRTDAWKQAVPGLAVALLMGNHDWVRSERAARGEDDTGRFRLLDPRRPWNHRGITFLGCPFSPPTPHWVKDYERRDADSDRLPDFGITAWATGNDGIGPVDVEAYFQRQPTLADELAAMTIPEDPWILVAHAPPFDTRLDQLPSVDYPIGSKAVREFVESRRPFCALHGHVHESPAASGSYAEEIGGVLCVNPGQSHERLQAVLFDTDNPRATLRHTVFV